MSSDSFSHRTYIEPVGILHQRQKLLTNQPASIRAPSVLHHVRLHWSRPVLHLQLYQPQVQCGSLSCGQSRRHKGDGLVRIRLELEIKKDPHSNCIRSEHDLNHPHARWQFAYAGIGKSGKDEYIISNITSGTYLTAPGTPLPSKDLLVVDCMLIDDHLAGTKKEGLLTGSCLPPDDDRIRWSVIPLRNGTGAYWYVTMFRTSLFGALLWKFDLT